MLSAGMNGVENKIDPGDPFADNVYHFSPSERETKGVEMLPEHLGEAIDQFANDQVITEALGSYLTKNLVNLKTSEFESYNEHTGLSWKESRPKITSWEMQRYLTRC